MKRDKLVMDLVEKIQDTMQEIGDDRFYATIYAWCELEVLAGRVYAELSKKNGMINAQGDSRRLLNDFRQLRSTQLALSRELGLTPASLASIRSVLGRDKGEMDLVAAMAIAASDPHENVEPSESEPPESDRST